MRATRVLMVLGLVSILLSAAISYALQPGGGSVPDPDRVIREDPGARADGKQAPTVTTKPVRINDGRVETRRVTISVKAPRQTTPHGAGTAAIGGTCWVDFLFLHEDDKARLYTDQGVQCTGTVDPEKVAITFYDSNVNAPQTVYARSDTTWYCHWLNRQCGGSKTVHSHRVRRTSYVTAKLELFASGGVHDVTWFGDFAYNDHGRAYPKIQDTRSHNLAEMLPFRVPAYGWKVCEDDPSATPPCYRSPNFRDDLKAAYRANGRRIPAGDVQAHHISPLRYGGGNSIPDNGVLLDKAIHGEFTSWWASFSMHDW